MKIIEYNEILNEFGNEEALISPQVQYEGEKLTAELINSSEGFDLLESEWNNLVELTDSHVFQTFDWQRLWWKYFGKDLQLHIIAFKIHDVLVGIAPFYVEKTSLLFNIKFLSLQLIGSSYTRSNKSGAFPDDSPSDFLDVIVNQKFENEVAGLLIQYLEKSGNLFNQVTFNEISSDSFLMRKVVPAMENHSWSVKKTRKGSYRGMFIADSVEEYLLDLSAKTKTEFRYSMHAVTEKRLFRIDHNESIETVRELYDEFVKLHQKRWNSIGLPGLFTDQNFKNFLQEVTERFYKNGWLRIKIAAIEKKILAVDYAFMYKKRLYDYQKVFDDLTPFSGMGTEKSFFHCIMEDMIQDGCVVYDLVRGDDSFRNQLSKRTKYNWNVTIPNPDQKKSVINKWYRFYCWVYNRVLRLNSEILMLKMRVKDLGLTGLIPVFRNWNRHRINRNKF